MPAPASVARGKTRSAYPGRSRPEQGFRPDDIVQSSEKIGPPAAERAGRTRYAVSSPNRTETRDRRSICRATSAERTIRLHRPEATRQTHCRSGGIGETEGRPNPFAGTGEETITVRLSKFSPRYGEQNADTPRQAGLAGLIVLASGRLHGLEPQPAATVSGRLGSGPSVPRRTCRALPIRNSCRSVPDLRAAYRRTVPSRAWPPRHAG